MEKILIGDHEYDNDIQVMKNISDELAVMADRMSNAALLDEGMDKALKEAEVFIFKARCALITV